MTEEEIRRVVLEELGNIAPEAEPEALAGDTDVREALDIDSMDVLNFVVALHQRLGVDVPERDYPKLLTVDGAVAYLAARAPSPSTG